MPVKHIDFVFPKEFYGVIELRVILLLVLPRVIFDLKEVLGTKSLNSSSLQNLRSSFLKPGEYNAGA